MNKILNTFLSLILAPYSFVVLVIAFFVVIVPISLVSATFLRRQSARLRLTQWFWGLFGKIIVYIVALQRLYIEDQRDEKSKKMATPEGLYIANHSSYMDIPILLTKFRIPPIMKKEVIYIPIFGLCGYAAGAIVLDRKNNDSRKKVYEISKDRLLNHDRAMQYYPEGTRQKTGGAPKDFSKVKTRLIGLAYELGVPVYAASIYGSGHILSNLGLCHYFKKNGLYLHPAIYPKDFASKEEFIKQAWDNVVTGYHYLEEKVHPQKVSLATSGEVKLHS